MKNNLATILLVFSIVLLASKLILQLAIRLILPKISHLEFAIIDIIASLLIALIFFKFYKRNKPEKSAENVIKDIINGNISGYYGLTGLLFIVIALNITSNYLFNFLDKMDISSLLYAVTYLLNIISFGFLYLILYPERKSETNYKLAPRKILIMALSKPNKDVSELRDYILDNKIDTENSRINWQLPLRALNFHKDTSQKCYFLVSKESLSQFEEFKKLAGLIIGSEKVDNIIEAVETDFNDDDNIMDSLHNILKRIAKMGFENEDISVNISGGTSAVTACLTIFALEDKRQIEYFAQTDQAKHKALDISREHAIRFLTNLSIK